VGTRWRQPQGATTRQLILPSDLLSMVPRAQDCADAFKKAMFQDPENWTASHKDEDVFIMFRRGPPFCNAHVVTHGAPLSVAYNILRDGIRVGDGQHAKNGRPMHGVFCMHKGSVENRIGHARDRSTSNRCPQFQKDEWPTAWTVPCVLAWITWRDTHVSHLERFADGCWKSCIASTIGGCLFWLLC
jgi:hypothetical protein